MSRNSLKLGRLRWFCSGIWSIGLSEVSLRVKELTMLKALAGGVVGAVTLNAVHESMRRAVPHAPRVDVIGTRAIRRPIEAAGYSPPKWSDAHRYALYGDLASNAAYYSLAAIGQSKNATARGALLGFLGGVGAAVLPPLIGLGKQPHRASPWTELMTVAWYTIGGIAAGKAIESLGD
jgi:hypothetical protein